MPRYVVLRHEPSAEGGKPLHWDFMLESDNVLRTWALSDEPRQHCEINAEQLADHRLAYLEFEGQISGNRGIVQHWDAGSYELVHDGEGIVAVRLTGCRLQGEVKLTRLSGDDQRWIFAFSPGMAIDR